MKHRLEAFLYISNHHELRVGPPFLIRVLGNIKIYVDLNSVLSPYLLNYQITLVFHMAFAHLRIALARKQTAQQSCCS